MHLCAQSKKEVYDHLKKWQSKWQPYMDAVMSRINIHWIGAGDIKRAKNKVVTPIPKIRSHYCFRVAGSNKIGRRLLSCYCDECLKGTCAGFAACEQKDIVGEWEEIISTMKNSAGIAARRRQESADEKAAAKQWIDLAGRARVGDVVVIDGHEGVAFTLGEIDETMRKASAVCNGDNPLPRYKGRGRKKAPPR